MITANGAQSAQLSNFQIAGIPIAKIHHSPNYDKCCSRVHRCTPLSNLQTLLWAGGKWSLPARRVRTRMCTHRKAHTRPCTETSPMRTRSSLLEHSHSGLSHHRQSHSEGPVGSKEGIPRRNVVGKGMHGQRAEGLFQNFVANIVNCTGAGAGFGGEQVGTARSVRNGTGCHPQRGGIALAPFKHA